MKRRMEAIYVLRDGDEILAAGDPTDGNNLGIGCIRLSAVQAELVCKWIMELSKEILAGKEEVDE